MYITAQDLKLEIREVNATINQVANDQGGDIQYLHHMVQELQQTVNTLSEQIEMIKGSIDDT